MELLWQDIPCVEWDGYFDKDGYGLSQYDGKLWRVTRLEWTRKIGSIPDGMYVLHRCDNPPCFEIAHLFLGTQADNMRDKVSKGRQSYGESHGRSVLSSDQVKKIRELWATGRFFQRDLARDFGVTQPHISDIIHNKKRSYDG